MTRAVLFDTETTGLDPFQGDRIIEIAAIELRNDLPTGVEFHTLLDPERSIPEEASRIHGFRDSDVVGKPKFSAIVDRLLAFFGDDSLIAHNAAFDFGFLDAELARINRPPLDRVRMVDTLALAKARFPGVPNNLDSLCRRFGIDLSARTTHNALLDCKLLADVYVELTGGRQRGLSLEANPAHFSRIRYKAVENRCARLMSVSDDERAAHQAFVATLNSPVWQLIDAWPASSDDH